MAIIRRSMSIFLAFAILLTWGMTGLAAEPTGLDAAVEAAAAYVYKAVPHPGTEDIGGEWAVIGLARSGYKVPDSYFEEYYKAVEADVREKKGVLHDKKYTDYSRVILGVTAAGYDARNVAGYDLTLPLGDFEKTIWQGLNGPIWALIALDSGDYPVPENPAAKTQATRERYVDEILRRQIPAGGWNLTAGANGPVRADAIADPDITGMALQALAEYQSQPAVSKAIEKALDNLSKMQEDTGGYTAWDNTSSESVAQVLTALAALKVPMDDPRFVKSGNSLLSNILTYRNSDGSFIHSFNGSGVNQMTTEQAFYSLVAVQRARDGKSSLYSMSDAKPRGEFSLATAPLVMPEPGLPGKNPDVGVKAVVNVGQTFSDISNYANRQAIEELASREIISGMEDGAFDPDRTMTRAEFATIAVQALNLKQKTGSVFTDVPSDQWYAPFVSTANDYGIVNGVGDGKYDPSGIITREEGAVMTARAAKLCGMENTLDDSMLRDVLAQFGDYMTVSDWARSSLAFCYKEDILSQSDPDIRPKAAITRGEVAEMLFRLLKAANLL